MQQVLINKIEHISEIHIKNIRLNHQINYKETMTLYCTKLNLESSFKCTVLHKRCLVMKWTHINGITNLILLEKYRE